jgi:hypothetical protein
MGEMDATPAWPAIDVVAREVFYQKKAKVLCAPKCHIGFDARPPPKSHFNRVFTDTVALYPSRNTANLRLSANYGRENLNVLKRSLSELTKNIAAQATNLALNVARQMPDLAPSWLKSDIFCLQCPGNECWQIFRRWNRPLRPNFMSGSVRDACLLPGYLPRRSVVNLVRIARLEKLLHKADGLVIELNARRCDALRSFLLSTLSTRQCVPLRPQSIRPRHSRLRAPILTVSRNYMVRFINWASKNIGQPNIWLPSHGFPKLGATRLGDLWLGLLRLVSPWSAALVVAVLLVVVSLVVLRHWCPAEF